MHIHARSKAEQSKVIPRTTKQRQLFRTVISSVNFERHCGSEAGSSSPEVANVGRCGVFEARPSRVKLWSAFERLFRAAQRSRAGSSGHSERPNRAERARSWKRRQVRCFRAAKPSNFERPGGAERVRTAISSAPAEPSGLERPFRAPQRGRAGSSGHFKRPGEAERVRLEKRTKPLERRTEI